MEDKKTHLKDRLVGATGSISGIASILGSWQVCHSVCLGLIALLSVMGIVVTGMPLYFLTTVAIPLWTVAVVLLLVTFGLYVKKKCISKNLILFNSGLIIAGVPFQAVQGFSAVFWTVGGLVAATGIALFVKDRLQKRRIAHG
ncbi:hypothetical protein HY493_00465 [Candidatus Woesearchaeota archaeon]|nr:hypothetical protein [Candidatus Woesearchaeota archaeon]